VFNGNQRQITFYLKSRYTFAQQTASASGQRYAFHVRDGSGNHSMFTAASPVPRRLAFSIGKCQIKS
jgi:hypothetical protein